MPPPPPPALECPPSSRQALPASLQLHGHALRPCGCPYLGHLHKLALHRVLQGHEPRAVRRQQAAGGGFPSVGPAGFPEAPPASLIALQHPEVRKEVPLSRPGKRDKAASGPAANGCRRSGETRGGAREPIPEARNAKGMLPQSPATSPATRGLVAACGSHLAGSHCGVHHSTPHTRLKLVYQLHIDHLLLTYQELAQQRLAAPIASCSARSAARPRCTPPLSQGAASGDAESSKASRQLTRLPLPAAAAAAAAAAMSDLGRQLADPPTDGITSLNFYEDSSMLLASSWDGVSEQRRLLLAAAVLLVLYRCQRCRCCNPPDALCLPSTSASKLACTHRLQTARVYETAEGALRGTFAAGAPLLDAAFENEGAVYTAGLNHAVKRCEGLFFVACCAAPRCDVLRCTVLCAAGLQYWAAAQLRTRGAGPCTLRRLGAPVLPPQLRWFYQLRRCTCLHAASHNLVSPAACLQLRFLQRARGGAGVARRRREVPALAAHPRPAGQRRLGQHPTAVGPPRGARSRGAAGGGGTAARKSVQHGCERRAASGGDERAACRRVRPAHVSGGGLGQLGLKRCFASACSPLARPCIGLPSRHSSPTQPTCWAARAAWVVQLTS